MKKRKWIMWAVMNENEVVIYDSIPCFYSTKKEAKEQCDPFTDEYVKKVKVEVKEI